MSKLIQSMASHASKGCRTVGQVAWMDLKVTTKWLDDHSQESTARRVGLPYAYSIIDCPRDGWRWAESEKVELIYVTREGRVVGRTERLSVPAFQLGLHATEAHRLASACHDELHGEPSDYPPTQQAVRATVGSAWWIVSGRVMWMRRG